MNMTLTKEQTQQLWQQDLEGYELIEEGDWVVDGKYQLITIVVKHVETGKYYEYYLSRSGSPFSDYYYSFEDEGAELHEVELVTKTITFNSWEKI